MDIIDSLREELAGEHPRRAVVWGVRPHRDSNEVSEVQSLDLTKPCLIFFGGGAYTSIGKDLVLPQFNTVKDMLAPDFVPSEYHFYSMTDDGSVNDKEKGLSHINKKNLAYNNHPHHFYSKKAAFFVDQLLMPHIPDRAADPAQVKGDINTIARKFSKITFLGFSYGGVFVQEIRNALNERLDAKGYNNKEQDEIMNAMASVNLGPTFTHCTKYPDIPQATLILAADKGVVKATRVSPANPDIEFNNPLLPICYAHSGKQCLIYGREGSVRLRRVAYGINNDVHPNLDTLKNMAMNWNEAQPDQPVDYEDRVISPHNNQLYSSNFRYGSKGNGIGYVFPSNHIGINSVRFLRDLVGASKEAQANHAVRDAMTVINACAETHLSSKKVREDEASIAFFQKMFANLCPENPAGKSL